MMKKRIGELLLERGVIDPVQLDWALEYQRSHRCRLGAALIEMGFATEEQVLSALADRLGLVRINLDRMPSCGTMKAAASLLPEDVARSQGVCPLSLDRRTLTVALRDPTDLALIDELAFRTGCRLRVVVAGEREIWRATARLYSRHELDLDVDSDLEAPPYLVPLMDVSFSSSGGAPTWEA